MEIFYTARMAKGADNMTTKNILNKDYDYYEIVNNNKGKFYKVHGYTGDINNLKASDIINFFCNWDMTWKCNFVKKYKDYSLLLKII